ncbi:MAG: type 4a pilus biogenesis protein PilO [Candidatus Omnitrophica bacterium]|nr:type 4a pilus biogenesis protein PilO [Candidatus Omnitrophota bacterium]
MNLESLKEDKSQQIILSIFAAYVLAAALFYFIFLGPRFSALKEVKASVNEKGAGLNMSGDCEKQREKIEEAKKKISKLKSKINYYERMLPTEKDIPYLLQYLSGAAKQTNVKLFQIEKKAEIKAEKEQAIYATVPLALKLKGGYHSIGLFINKLENAERFMKIQSFEIKSNDKARHEHKADILVYTYMLIKENGADDESL